MARPIFGLRVAVVLIPIVAVAGVLWWPGCGREIATPAPQGPLDMSGIPKASDPVVAAEPAPSSIQVSDLFLKSARAAPTGLLLKSLHTTPASWTDKSRMLCETARIARDTFREAATADRNLCYVGVMDKYKFFKTPYDGYQHYVKIADFPGGTAKIRFVVTKSSDWLASVKVWTCLNGGTAQDAFDGTSFGGGKILKISAGRRVDSNGVGLSRVNLTGTINENSQLTAKTMTHTYSYTASDYTSVQSALVTQTATDIIFQGYTTMTGDTVGTNQYQFYSRADLLNADALTTLALGDGSGKVKVTHTDAGTITNYDASDTWTGADQKRVSPASGGTYYTEVSGQTLPPTATPTTGFQGTDETWDCSLPTGSTWENLDFDNFKTDTTALAEFEACDSFYQLASFQWPVCQNGG